MKLKGIENKYRARLFFAEEINETEDKDRWHFVSDDGKKDFGEYPFEPDTVMQDIIEYYNIQVDETHKPGKLTKIKNIKVRITKPTAEETKDLNMKGLTAKSVIEYWGKNDEDVTKKFNNNIRGWIEGKYTLVDTRCTDFPGADKQCEKGLSRYTKTT